jgi:hypothetical protein
MFVLVQPNEQMRAAESLIRKYAAIFPALQPRTICDVLVNPHEIHDGMVQTIAETAGILAVVLVKDAGKAFGGEDVCVC